MGHDKDLGSEVTDGKVHNYAHSFVKQSLCQVLGTRIMSSIVLLFMKKILKNDMEEGR